MGIRRRFEFRPGQAGFRPGGRLAFFGLCRKKVSKERFFWLFVVLAMFFSGGKPGFGPAGELLFLALSKESKQRKVFLVGWLFLAPVASRVSPRRASYFFLRRQKKVTKKKASHVRAASRCLALLAAFGTLANSLRSNSASVLIRTLLRCSARPNGGGIPHGSSASRTSPVGLVRFAHLAGCGLPHFSTLTSHKGTARRATTPNPLIPHASLLITGNHKGCPYDLTPHSYGLTPHSSLLTPHSYDLTPTAPPRKVCDGNSPNICW